jgi:hypothetical protein
MSASYPFGRWHLTPKRQPPKLRQCWGCYGSGSVNDCPCRDCDGSGYIEEPQPARPATITRRNVR